MVGQFFSGGEKMDQLLKEMSDRVLEKGELEVGFPEGTPTYENGTSVPMVAAIHEFGAPRAHIPKRPIFAPMIKDRSDEWVIVLTEYLKASDFSSAISLDGLGEVMRADLQLSIQSVIAPPLSPVTLMLRKMKRLDQSLRVTMRTVREARAKVKAGEDYSEESTKPLEDTKHMIQNVIYTVK